MRYLGWIAGFPPTARTLVEHLERQPSRLQRQAGGRGRVPDVDVGPQSSAAAGRVPPDPGDRRSDLVWPGDEAEPQRRNGHPRPAVEHGGRALVDLLGESVRIGAQQRMILVDWSVEGSRGGGGEARAERRDAGCDHRPVHSL